MLARTPERFDMHLSGTVDAEAASETRAVGRSYPVLLLLVNGRGSL